MFDMTFMRYALVIALLLAVSASLLSPFLVLHHQAMIADGLSHVAFTGMIIGFLVSEEALLIALPFVALMSVLITYLSERVEINSDASISVVASFALALGLIIASVGPGFNRSIETLLVGSILTVTFFEIMVAALLLVVIIIYVLFNYRHLILITYDENYALSKGVRVRLYRYLTGVVTALFVVVGVKSVGTLMISALTVFPALIAVQGAKSFGSTLLRGLIASMIAVILGLVLSYYLGLPSGSTIVLVYMFLLLAMIMWSKLRA